LRGNLSPERLIFSYLRAQEGHRRGLSSLLNLWWISPRGAEYILSLELLDHFKDVADLEKCAKLSLHYYLDRLRIL
ncbi:hypothetical protein CLOP_g9947, partial [Closterium sp. NIES-67]